MAITVHISENRAFVNWNLEGSRMIASKTSQIR